MPTYTPARATPTATRPGASEALKRLLRTQQMLASELQQLPQAAQALLDALSAKNEQDVKTELANLLQQVDDFWLAPSAPGKKRRAMFTTRLKRTLMDEALLKSHENELGPNAASCLAIADNDLIATPAPSAFALYVKLIEQTPVEIKGALVMSVGEGRTLLALPGSGLAEFATRQGMLETVARWLGDEALRWALLVNADQRQQDAVAAVVEDPELFMEPFSAADVLLKAIPETPCLHAVLRQIDKQREDLRYVCGDGLNVDPALHKAQIDGAIRMDGLFGPSAMLERREQRLSDRALRQSLPDWMKLASAEDLQEYEKRLKRYDQARDALFTVLNGAASAEQYANVSVRASLASGLGYDLQPDSIVVSTQRSLAVTGESYTLKRTLPQLALYGLHPDDDKQGSDFLTRTTVSIDDAPVQAAHALLTPTYIAQMVGALNLRISFGAYQQTTYGKKVNQQLMEDALRAQVAASAFAAQKQGHISADDLKLIEAITESTPAEDAALQQVQQIRINGSAVLGRVLVFRKESAEGVLDRLIIFTADAPHPHLFKSFSNETQLLHELVEWAEIPQMSDYLLAQVPVPARAALAETLEALRQKPHPQPDFVTLEPLDNFEAGLGTFVSELIKVSVSNHQAHTPSWFQQASESQRQELLALEEAAEAAASTYQAHAHTNVQDFEIFVHQRASEKISKLLGAVAGSVDPDRIIITSERETLTYTSMVRNGYDDTLGFLNPAADTMATFSGPEGVDLSALTPATVAGSVRGTWLADSYAALVRNTLLDPQSTGYQYRRQARTLITQLQMQAAALRALLKGHIDATQYHWLEPSLGKVHLSDAETRARWPIYPLQIHVDKPFIASRLELIDQLVIADTALTHVETVQGCFALLPTDTRQTALLYTPKAPDGIEFRMFSSFVESLGQPGMIDYYKDRCRINARRILSFFLNDMQQGNANKPPFIPKQSIADFAQVCFNRTVERKLRDVEETTIGRHDMLSNTVWNAVDIVAIALTAPFPPASFAVGATLVLRENAKAINALASESPEDAVAHLFAALLNTAGAAGDFYIGMKGFAGLARKLSRDASPGALPAALKDTPQLSPVHNDLYPVKLQDESFLITKPNANGQAAVYRSVEEGSDEVLATRHYAAKDSQGVWQPLGQPATPTPPLAANAVSANRVVSISLQDLPRVAEGHAKGVTLGNGKYYIEMNSLVYQVHYDPSLRCWHIVDPQNQFAFFGRQPVQLNEQGQWQLIQRSALRGGGKDTPAQFSPLREQPGPSRPASTSLQEYELPKKMQIHSERILNIQPIDEVGLGLEEYFEIYYTQMRQVYSLLRDTLYHDASAFFATRRVLPPRPLLPSVDTSMNVAGFLEEALAHSNGLVLSEGAKSIASKRLLITHMQTLADQRVEVIYLPYLFTDKHTRKLAKYHAKGRNIRSGSHEIKNHLTSINDGELDNLSREFDYYHLIKAAHQHNIEVRPLSSSVSYPMNAYPLATAATDATAGQKMSNFFGHRVISGDLAVDPSKRWVALVEHKLATTHDQVTGLAEMEGVISARIDDVPAGQATRITRHPGLVATDASATPSDFKIEFPESAAPATSASPAVASTSTSAVPGSTLSSNGASQITVDTSNIGFRWEKASGWEPVAHQDWLADSPATALQQSLADAAYEVPAELRSGLHDLVYVKHKGLDTRYFVLDKEVMVVQDQFSILREQLHLDSRSILSSQLPPRPVMPVVEPQPSIGNFIEDVYQHTDGMVVGEFHASIASKKFIIDNLPLLKEQNVKTLYMEHLLTDLHQTDLDRFIETGQMGKRLLHSLRTLDRGHITDPGKVYTFEKLVVEAQQQGIEIRGIDCAASYHLKGLGSSTATARQQMMSYFASRTIRRHQAVMGKHKWVALVGNSHSNTFADTVPGLAELEGAIGVRLNDVSPGASHGVVLDAGETVRDFLGRQEHLIKGDFRVDMVVTRSPMAIRPPQPLSLEHRLARPGMFLTEQEPDNLHLIIHRSRDGAIHRTPIKVNDVGKVYVDRATWTAVHLQPYDDIDALVSALEEINLTRA